MPSDRTMVDYQTWTEIAFDVTESKGAQYRGPTGGRNRAGGRSFERGNEAAETIQIVAELWNEFDLDEMTASEARELAKREIEVR